MNFLSKQGKLLLQVYYRIFPRSLLLAKMGQTEYEMLVSIIFDLGVCSALMSWQVIHMSRYPLFSWPFPDWRCQTKLSCDGLSAKSDA